MPKRLSQIVKSRENENVPPKKIRSSVSANSIPKLYLNEERADVHFIFNTSNERIPAHTTILAAMSDAFNNNTFFQLMKKEILIEDASADAFKQFLQFAYLKEVELSNEHIHSVIQMCDKYQVHEGVNICSMFLKENLTIDDICAGYQIAIRHHQDDLKDYCKQIVIENPERVFKSEGFLQCDWIVLNEIVKLDHLSCLEKLVLEACIDWAQNACRKEKLPVEKENIRKLLKHSIYEIRFRHITLDELVDINTKLVYNEDELYDIMSIMAKRSLPNTKFKQFYRKISMNSIIYSA